MIAINHFTVCWMLFIIINQIKSRLLINFPRREEIVVILCFEYLGQSVNQLRFCPLAGWSLNATTFAKNYTSGSSIEVIFIDKNNNIFWTDSNSNEVQIWLNGSTTPSRIISSNISSPKGIFATSNGNIYISHSLPNYHVEKWTLNSTNSVNVMNVAGLCYLFVDTNDTLYCSIYSNHKVVKLSLLSGGTTPVLAVGTGSGGSGPDTLNGPYGVYVDTNFKLYVADCNNNRIQLFPSGQLNGTTVAGIDAPIPTSLNCPTGITLDADGYLFIVELNSHRIGRLGPNGYQCIGGCSGSGSSASQFSGPHSFNFDIYGNIFVADKWNARIQKFSLTTNSCGEF